MLNLAATPLQVLSVGDREKNPAQGLAGGAPGACASATINDTTPIRLKGRAVLDPGASVTFHFAGGGGFGYPGERDRAAVERDLALGYVSAEAAARDYATDAEAAA